MKIVRSHERTTNPTDGHKKVEMILTDGLAGESACPTYLNSGLLALAGSADQFWRMVML